MRGIGKRYYSCALYLYPSSCEKWEKFPLIRSPGEPPRAAETVKEVEADCTFCLGETDIDSESGNSINRVNSLNPKCSLIPSGWAQTHASFNIDDKNHRVQHPMGAFRFFKELFLLVRILLRWHLAPRAIRDILSSRRPLASMAEGQWKQAKFSGNCRKNEARKKREAPRVHQWDGLLTTLPG